MLLPERCSIKEKGKDCPMPPEFIISIKVEDEEYMIGITCTAHKEPFSEKLQRLQTEGKIPKGVIQFSGLKAVGTDCIRMDQDDLLQL